MSEHGASPLTLVQALKIALRQWKFYSEVAESNDGFDLAIEKSAEGDQYRACLAALTGAESRGRG